MGTYLVSGANGRIGSALCSSLSEGGHRVIALERPGVAPGPHSRLDQVEWCECDLLERSAIDLVAARLEKKCVRLNGLIHCAGIVGDSNVGALVTNLGELSEEACWATMQINTWAFIWMISALSNKDVFNHNASVVAINSIYGTVPPDFDLYSGTHLENPIPYAVSKFGLHGAIGWLSRYYKDQIRINSVAPGGIESDHMPEVFKERYCANTLSGKLVQVSDVLPAIEFLLSESSGAIYGQNIIVDGGFCV